VGRPAAQREALALPATTRGQTWLAGGVPLLRVQGAPLKSSASALAATRRGGVLRQLGWQLGRPGRKGEGESLRAVGTKAESVRARAKRGAAAAGGQGRRLPGVSMYNTVLYASVQLPS